MQYFNANGEITIGKHKGKLFCELPRQYLKWARKKLPQFKEQHNAITKGKRITHLDAPIKAPSACGNGYIASKAFQPPTGKRFQSKARRIVGATLDSPKTS